MAKKKVLRAGVPGRASKRSPTAATAKRALLQAIEVYAAFRGEAQWTNGWRCGVAKLAGSEDDERLYQKEMAQWQLSGKAFDAVDKAIRALQRAARAK